MVEQENAVRELMLENKDEGSSIGRREPSNSGPKVLVTVSLALCGFSATH